ncbi:uncharacterized protein LY89DRAFT_167467 [Mollisia scopiformis]|uniref:C2H2 type master regulator of conidiophore development brlA n=1 Tax=Mollisia scopiformis TaxID=149040 RepID=A0A194XTT1_MOLSC|nr:uncharacterized protein LY89DRAFT_167467 [Mollisia scopiformis]KUJ23107.1 hypothetical protein LY89DRAFT_167467 [Mollisia scopiformis]
MELTPQSARSPTSPYPYSSNPQPLYEYPSPAQSDSRYRSTDSLQGLGLYSCPMSSSAVENVSVTSIPSPAGSTNWSNAALQHRDTPRSSHSTPNLLQAEYDHFAPFHSTTQVPYSHDIYSAHTAEVNTVLPASPADSCNTSERSSFSSAPVSEIFTQAGSIHSFTPRIKMEDHPDFVGHDTMMMSSPQLSHTIMVSSAGPYAGSLDATFYDQPPMGWPKMEYGNPPDLPGISSLPIPHYDRRSESQERGTSGSQAQRRPNGVPRTRTRRLTSKEDANFQCHVKGCGKLFGRSYNFKAHMETHDASREYPFPCPVKDCNKKFVRKTDLQRHHQSVHMKQRNHRCDYCSRFFARKDTLRRHMEDGCSKRFDIETVDFRPQSYSNTSDHHNMRIPARSSVDTHHASRQASYSSGTHYTPPPHSVGSSTSRSNGGSGGPQTHDSSLTSAPGGSSYLERQEYHLGQESGGGGHEAVWSN